MNTWITSDLHLSHTNILKYNPKYRQYGDVDEMNEAIVAGWNAQVQPDDLTYILGDVAFCNPKKATEFMKRMNGRKILIEGNHDRKLVKDAAFRACFEEIHVYHEVSFDSVKICMFHYPIFDHNGSAHGSLMLHGHRHGNPTNIPGRIMDVGFDATGFVVSNLSEVVRTLTKITPMPHH